MATKCIVIGGKSDKKKLKPIEFNSLLIGNSTIRKTDLSPKSYKYIELISEGYSPDFDVMFAYFDTDYRAGGNLFLGKWNDGVV